MTAFLRAKDGHYKFKNVFGRFEIDLVFDDFILLPVYCRYTYFEYKCMYDNNGNFLLGNAQIEYLPTYSFQSKIIYKTAEAHYPTQLIDKHCIV